MPRAQSLKAGEHLAKAGSGQRDPEAAPEQKGGPCREQEAGRPWQAHGSGNS